MAKPRVRTRRPVGRPTKKVPTTLDRLEEALRKGLPRWAACAYARIDYSTFKDWLNKDPDFSLQVAEWEAAAMEDLIEGAKKEVKGNQYLLSRRFRQDYGEKVEIESKGEQRLIIEVVERDKRAQGGGSSPHPTPTPTGD